MTKNINTEEDKQMLKSLIFVSLISADNDRYSEEIKQEILTRYDSAKQGYDNPIDSDIDWDWVFAPLGDNAEKYSKLMKA